MRSQRGPSRIAAPSVQSLVAFPQILGMMDGKPEWVQQLGDAFLAQPDEVMDAVQALRKRAQDAGGLESNDQQNVKVETDGSQQTIIIEPAQPQVVYVPTYNPTIVYGPWWWPHYPPPFYWPPPPGAAFVAGISFGIGIAITNSLWGGFSWHHHDIDVDVNRYNNININHHIDVDKTKVNWKHDPEHRRGVPYRDAKSRDNFAKKLPGAQDRRDFRGHGTDREASRERARETLARRGTDPAQARDKLRNDPGTREQAQAAARNVDRDRARAAAQKVDRDRARQVSANRKSGHALSGAGLGHRERAVSARGIQSRRAAGGFHGRRR